MEHFTKCYVVVCAVDDVVDCVNIVNIGYIVNVVNVVDIPVDVALSADAGDAFCYRSLDNSRLRKSRDLDDASGGNERGERESGADTNQGEHRLNTPSDKPLKLRFIMQ